MTLLQQLNAEGESPPIKVSQDFAEGNCTPIQGALHSTSGVSSWVMCEAQKVVGQGS